MKLKAIALLALAAVGLGAGTSFEAYAYNRYDCLKECRADYDECLAEGGGSACLTPYAVCRNWCYKFY